jgi:hypothetical protein
MSDGASTVVGLPFTLSETFIGRGAWRWSNSLGDRADSGAWPKGKTAERCVRTQRCAATLM